MDFVGPLLRADGITVQGIYDRVALRFLLGITRWQKDDDVAINGISLQIAFESPPTDLDMLHGDRLRAGNHGRNFGLDLSRKPRTRSESHHERHSTKNLFATIDTPLSKH